MKPKKFDLVRDLKTSELGMFISEFKAVFPVQVPVVEYKLTHQKKVDINRENLFFKKIQKNVIKDKSKRGWYHKTVDVNYFEIIRNPECFEINGIKLQEVDREQAIILIGRGIEIFEIKKDSKDRIETIGELEKAYKLGIKIR